MLAAAAADKTTSCNCIIIQSPAVELAAALAPAAAAASKEETSKKEEANVGATFGHLTSAGLLRCSFFGAPLQLCCCCCCCWPLFKPELNSTRKAQLEQLESHSNSLGRTFCLFFLSFSPNLFKTCSFVVVFVELLRRQLICAPQVELLLLLLLLLANRICEQQQLCLCVCARVKQRAAHRQ